MARRVLDIENIGRIGLMFLDGDLLDKLLIDPFTCDEDDTDYDIPAFNALKRALMKIERMNPDMHIAGDIWISYRANKRMGVPVIAGKQHTDAGWIIAPLNEYLQKTLNEGINTRRIAPDGNEIWYFPITDTCGRVAGALELRAYRDRAPYEHRYDAVRARRLNEEHTI